MSTTYKLYNNTNSDGTVYLDVPISGRISNVSWSLNLVAGAGGVGVASGELSRSPTNQWATSNPRGVISHCAASSPAASQGGTAHRTDFMSEPIKAGERLYLNTAGLWSNIGSAGVACFITIS